MHGDRDVADKVMGRPWSEASVKRWHHAFHFPCTPRLATLLPGCRDVFLVSREAISQVWQAVK